MPAHTLPSGPDDQELERLLKRSGAKISLAAIYGLFYGCLAAPRPVAPSMYLPVIFGKEPVPSEPSGAGGAPGSKSPGNSGATVMEGLSSLWNRLARWKPSSAPIILPESHYSDDTAGLLQRAADAAALIEYFMEGIALGGTRDEDLSEVPLEALDILGRVRTHLEEYRDALKRGNEELGMSPQETRGLLEQVEAAIADSIACVSLGLLEARRQGMQTFTALARACRRGGHADFCDCGSGRKYNRCCGLTH
ncbi:MAG: UPF0149 family protein [Nitrospirota bacterium]